MQKDIECDVEHVKEITAVVVATLCDGDPNCISSLDTETVLAAVRMMYAASKQSDAENSSNKTPATATLSPFLTAEVALSVVNRMKNPTKDGTRNLKAATALFSKPPGADY